MRSNVCRSDGSWAESKSISACAGAGRGAAGAEQVGIEALHHLSVGQIRGDIGRRDLLSSAEQQQRGDTDRQADRGEEAEHADRNEQADRNGRQADQADRDPSPDQRPPEPGVQPLPLPPRSVAHGAVALVQRPHDAVGAGNGEFGLVRGHFCSMGVKGDAAFSSFDCATPSPLAI